jgi:hypothetical protein
MDGLNADSRLKYFKMFCRNEVPDKAHGTNRVQSARSGTRL